MIGVFDSGYGGLTVLKEFLSDLGQYDYVYLGDNARAPYGIRSNETVFEYAKQSVEFLFKKGCYLIIIACNTASAVALRRLQQEYLPKNFPDRRILGVVRPLVEAAGQTDIKDLGIVGTKSTINSRVYEIEIKKIKSNLQVWGQACPLLVPLIEEGWLKRKETKSILRYYLKPLKKLQIKKLILACTHYPLLYDLFAKEIGNSCQVLNSGKIVCDSLKDYLNRHPEIEKNISKNRKRVYLTTDCPNIFSNFGSKFLGQKITAQKIALI